MNEIVITTEDELLAMLVSPDPAVRRAAVESEHATEAVLLAALDTPTPDELDYKYLPGAQQHPYEEMDYLFCEARAAACKNPNVTEKVLLHALKSEIDLYSCAAKAAVESEHATEAVLLAGIETGDIYIQTEAAASPNATEKVLVAAMSHRNDDHEDFHLRMASLENPNATFGVFVLGLRDADFVVKTKATERMQQFISLVTGKAKSAPWIFIGWDIRTGLYVFRGGGERLCLTLDELRQAMKDGCLSAKPKGGRLRKFFAILSK